MRTHIVVTCHRCGHEWAYMGSKIKAVLQGQGSLKVKCGKCRANTKIMKKK